jgi:hypothetical protein
MRAPDCVLRHGDTRRATALQATPTTTTTETTTATTTTTRTKRTENERTVWKPSKATSQVKVDER